MARHTAQNVEVLGLEVLGLQELAQCFLRFRRCAQVVAVGQIEHYALGPCNLERRAPDTIAVGVEVGRDVAQGHEQHQSARAFLVSLGGAARQREQEHKHD